MNNANFMQPLANYLQFYNFLLKPKMNLESLILNWPTPQNVNTNLQVSEVMQTK